MGLFSNAARNSSLPVSGTGKVLVWRFSPVSEDVLPSGAGVGSSSGAAVASGADVYAVLAEDVDTTDEAKEAAVYLTGEFNEKALIVAEGAAADFKKSARKVSIFIKPCM